MFDTTRQKLVDELVGWGYVVLLVDSFATRGIDHACTGGVSDIAGNRRSDAYGALAFLAGQTPKTSPTRIETAIPAATAQSGIEAGSCGRKNMIT